ncbi:M20 family metallopeptidase [Thalassotalea fusca]
MSQYYDFSQLAQLVNINSYTKNKVGVDAVASLYSQWMKELGFAVNRYKRAEIGDHLHFISSKQVGKKVLLLGHFDTVFPPQTFEGFSEDEGWIYGPGVCDMKGGNMVALEALRNVHQQHGEIANIDVLMVSDEETGSDDSKALTAQLARDYDLCLVFEAAGPAQEIVIARKGIATFTILIEGKAAHAGNHYQDGINANLAAAHMVISLTSLTDLSRGSTVNAGKIAGGIGANTISPRAEIKVEARFTGSQEKQRILDGIEEIANAPKVKGVRVSLTGGVQRDVMQTTEQQVSLIQTFEAITEESFKLERRGGVSDANVVSAIGIPTLDGFGPFGDGDHTENERACKKSYLSRIALVSKILNAYNGVQKLPESDVA